LFHDGSLAVGPVLTAAGRDRLCLRTITVMRSGRGRMCDDRARQPSPAKLIVCIGCQLGRRCDTRHSPGQTLPNDSPNEGKKR
jgi:hypothetical protein